MRVMILVTHLLGTGHLSRALTLGRAFGNAGHDAHVVSGGVPVGNLPTEGITLHQLPPVKSDGVNFTTLLTQQGGVADADYLASRKAALLSCLERIEPDVIITELYPFGRRVLKGEFQAVLNRAQESPYPPLVFSSIRDILAPPSKPEKALETEAVTAVYYDGVLVHSDAGLTPLEASWPVGAMLADKLQYTGYVAPPAAGAHPDGTGTGEILVTAGGGSVGRSLFETAVTAASLDTENHWRLLVGGSDQMQIINNLQSQVTSNNVTIETTRPDFRQMLTGAKIAVCMCGYNTAMDLLQSRTPAVFVPFDAGGEVEQTLRAESLAKQTGFTVVRAADATPEALVAAVQGLSGAEVQPLDPKQFQGAAQAVEIVEQFYEKHIGEEQSA
ncbi:glycosyltransferase family protein [Neptunicoccus cionae]|uniref:glycosyltransferase family protein n=1 Tax=Neptunicoccus cionae TaxID=2035344 RepID=UPI000C764434|nr:glycosyltransferase [Amylibacter cionae]PLS22640.1 glycosyltransferase [Amylibacter cionae]